MNKIFSQLFAVGLLVAAPAANAVVMNFTEDHATGGLGQPPPYGTVTLTQNGSTVDFSVDLLNGNKFVKSGAGDFMYFKFNGTGVVLGDITVDNAGFAAFTGAFSGNGTGLFAFGITNPTAGNGGGASVFGPITFHVGNSVIADFTTTANNLGFLFAADVLSPNGNTGPIGVIPGEPGNPPGVPDGGTTLVLFGFALGAIAFIRRHTA